MNGEEMLTDYISGEAVTDTGAEQNRQAVERFLVEKLGYRKEDIVVDVPIAFTIAGQEYRSALDLVVKVDGTPGMVIKCAAGSLGSREREVVAAARLAGTAPLPVAVASDGDTALVFDGLNGKMLGQGMAAIPGPDDLKGMLTAGPVDPLPEERLHRERLIFRSYDSMNVNR